MITTDIILGLKKANEPEQVLNFFDVPLASANMAYCPFHNDDTASLQLNKDYVYCHGCNQSWNTFDLAKALLEKRNNREFSIAEVVVWFENTPLPAKTGRKYAQSSYMGAVNPKHIAYWQNQLFMRPERIEQLQQERLLTLDTIKEHKLGWRPDYEAFVIPFLRPDGIADIVQFRMTNGKTKYLGLAGHNRASVMNMHLLNKVQPYVVVLFGCFDPILAAQDGLIVVGTSGDPGFAASDEQRVKDLFANQHTKFVVPDNTASENSGAFRLAEWIGAQVRFYDSNLPDGTDYIKYRQMGYSAQDFMCDVVGYEPQFNVKETALESIYALVSAGDPYNFIPVHLNAQMRGIPVRDIARSIAKRETLNPIPQNMWYEFRKMLWGTHDLDRLYETLTRAANYSMIYKKGAW